MLKYKFEKLVEIPDEYMIQACNHVTRTTGQAPGDNWGEKEAALAREKLSELTGLSRVMMIETDVMRRWCGHLRRRNLLFKSTKTRRGQPKDFEINAEHSTPYQEYLRSDQWELKRTLYKKTYCQLDQTHEGPFDLHHNNYRCLEEVNGVIYGNETASDLITLCRKCHRRHHKYLKKYS